LGAIEAAPRLLSRNLNGMSLEITEELIARRSPAAVQPHFADQATPHCSTGRERLPRWYDFARARMLAVDWRRASLGPLSSRPIGLRTHVARSGANDLRRFALECKARRPHRPRNQPALRIDNVTPGRPLRAVPDEVAVLSDGPSCIINRPSRMADQVSGVAPARPTADPTTRTSSRTTSISPIRRAIKWGNQPLGRREDRRDVPAPTPDPRRHR
jgi:hypothetical protein